MDVHKNYIREKNAKLKTERARIKRSLSIHIQIPVWPQSIICVRKSIGAN